MATPKSVPFSITLPSGARDITEAGLVPVMTGEQVVGLNVLSPEEFKSQASSLVLSERFKGLDPGTKVRGLLGETTVGQFQEGETLLDFINRTAGTDQANEQIANLKNIISGQTVSSQFFEQGGQLLTESAAFATPEQKALDAQILAQRRQEVAFEDARVAEQRGLPGAQQDAPPTTDLQQRVLDTEGALLANKEFVNATFRAFHGRDANQVELDRFTGNSVEDVRNAVISGARTAGLPTSGFFAPEIIDPDTGETIDPDFSGEGGNVNVDAPTEFDSDFISDALSDAITNNDFDALLSQITAAQEAFIESLQPSDETVDLQTQLAEQNALIETFQQSFLEGIETIEGQPIAMQFIAGQQTALERQAGIQLQGLSRVQANLIDQLEISVSQDQVKQMQAQATADFMLSNTSLAFQISDRIQAEEDRIADRATQLETSALNKLTTILTTFQGQYWDNLDAESKTMISQIANEAGIPVSLVETGMNTVANQVAADITGADMASVLGYEKTFTDEDGQNYGINPDGTIEKIDFSKLVVPEAGTDAARGNTIFGDGVITAYGSYEEDGTPIWEHGLDIQLNGGTNAQITMPYDFEVTQMIPSAQSGGFGNQIRGVFTTGPFEGQEVWLSHLDSFEVSQGEWSAGTVLGFQGATGTTRGPTGIHLDVTMPKASGGFLSPTAVAKIVSPEIMGTKSEEKGTFNEAIEFLSGHFSGQQREAVLKNAETIAETGDKTTQRDYVVSTLLSTLTADLQKNVIGRFTAIDSLNAIDDLLSQYEAEGGNTGIFAGTQQQIEEKIGRVGEPELANLANQIRVSIQQYRQSISGAAFTESEQVEYESVFPNIKNGPELNRAKIDSLLETLDRNQKTLVSSFIGTRSYEELLSAEALKKDNLSVEDAYLDQIDETFSSGDFGLGGVYDNYLQDLNSLF